MLLQYMADEFQITQIHSTPLHPESNAMVERYHRVVSDTVRALSPKFNYQWDRLLPYMLFAYRDAPQETTGFSPFELLFAYPVRSPLTLLHNNWTTEQDKDHPPDVIKFMTDVREKFHETREMATKNATSAQKRTRKWYKAKSRKRNFQPGDQVLAIIPKKKNPLSYIWSGPYTILQKVGNVNYWIKTQSKRKQNKLIHVNLLKKFHEREKLIDTNTGITLLTLSEVNETDENTDLFKIPELTLKNTNSNFDLSKVATEKQPALKKLLQKYKDVFSDVPGRTNLIEHQIQLQPDTRPIKQQPYRVNPIKAEKISTEIQDMLNMGIISESTSPWSSPIILIPKKDGSVRFTIDYRKVNSKSYIDSYPLPRIDDLIDKIGPAKYITKFDISKAFWQIPLAEESKPASAFITANGLYHFNVMPFGLSSATQTFQRLMQRILQGIDFCRTYCDDIVVFTMEDDWSLHLKHIEAVLQRIKNANLTIKKSKCEFGSATVTYLGHEIGHGSVTPSKVKIQAVLEAPTPTDKKKVRQWLGLTNFYRRFIPNMAHIAAPLTDLLKNHKTFSWNPEAQNAFDQIKCILSSEPILKPPDFSKPFVLAVDASNVATGAVLMQTYNEVEHPVCYFSKRLNSHQQNYSTVEKETLSIILAIRYFSIYLIGQKTCIHCDHNPLTWLNTMANTNHKLLRWSIEINQYNLEIKYRPGRENLIADILSRPKPNPPFEN